MLNANETQLFFGRDDFANVVKLPSKGIFTERKIRNDANGTADG